MILKRLLHIQTHQKLSILILLFWFVSSSCKAQETIWLDENLSRTYQNDAVYYRISEKLEGAVSYFYKNRTIYRKVFYKNGKIDGKFLEYYNTGELKEIGTYENGLREGNWREFYKNGKILRKGKYVKGEKVGIWKTFYKNVY